MSSVSSLGGSFGGSNINGAQSNRLGGPAKKIEKELNSFLDSKGLSAEQQASIKSDLQESIQASLRSGGPPNPAKIQESIKGVFEKHGLDGAEFTSKLPSIGDGRPGGDGSVKNSAETDYLESLLEMLDERAAKSKKITNESSGSSTSVEGESAQATNRTSNSRSSLSIGEASIFDVQA